MRHARTSLVALCWTLLSPPGQGCAQQGDGGPASSTQAGGAAAGSAGSAGKGPSVAGAGVGTAGAGAAAGQAGKGGASWTGPVGVGGMTPQGKTPVWKPVPGDPLGAGVEYLENGEEFTVFSWQPCAWLAGCEMTQLTMDAALIVGTEGGRFGSRGGLYNGDDATTMHLFVWRNSSPPGWLWVVPSDTGQLRGAMRMPDPSHVGLARISANSQSFFAGILEQTIPEEISPLKSVTGIMWDWGSREIHTFDIPVPSHFFATTPGTFTQNRVSMGWSNIDTGAISTFANNGSDVRLVAGPGQPLGYLSVTGSRQQASATHFYFASYISEPDGSYHVSIHRSDGVESPTSYLEPEPGWDLGRFGYAHSHIAWVRVTDWKDLNNYGRGELWASTFDEDPAKLKPVKLADVEPFEGVVNNETDYAAGFGHYAMWESPDPRRNIRIWNLAKRTSKAFKVPDDRESTTFLGMTKTHLYLGLARVAENEIFEIIRVEVD